MGCKEALCEQLWLLGVCLYFFWLEAVGAVTGALALSLPTRPGTASLQRAHRAGLGLCCLLDLGDVSSVSGCSSATPGVTSSSHGWPGGRWEGTATVDNLSGKCSVAGKQVSLQLECRPGFT